MELVFSCEALTGPNVVIVSVPENQEWKEFWRSEKLWEGADWSSSLLMTSYYTSVRIDVFSDQKFIAFLEIPGDQLFVPGDIRRQISSSHLLTIHCLEATENPSLLHLQILGHNLKTPLTRSVYFKVSKQVIPDQFIEVYTSECVSTHSPKWKEFSLELKKLCNSDENRIIKIACYSKYLFYTDQTIGEIQVNLRELLRDGFEYPIGLRGKIELNVKLEYRFTVDQFRNSGHRLSLLSAIDYSGSNKRFNDPSSLHCRKFCGKSMYQICLSEICEDLKANWHINRLGALGFGGLISDTCNKDCFSLKSGCNEPWVQHLEELEMLYLNSLGTVQPSGPTYLSHIINTAISHAETIKSNQMNEYLVLAILTDDCPSDMPNIIKSLQHVAELPLSILIIGMGMDKSQAFEYLEGLEYSRKIISYISSAHTDKNINNRIELQFSEYMTKNRIVPREATRAIKHIFK